MARRSSWKSWPALLATLVLLLGACATPDPTVVRRLEPHPATRGADGPLLLVDVCLARSPIDSDDYFVLANAQEGAVALGKAVAAFLEPTPVALRGEPLVLVCGALLDAANPPQRVAAAIDEAVSTQPQPLWAPPALAADPELLRALQILSTDAFARGIESAKPGSPPAQPSEQALQAAREAAAVVAHRTGRSGLLYVGVTGRSLSTGKALAFGIGRVAVGIATGMVPLIAGGGYVYSVAVIPGGPVDQRIMTGAMVDLRDASITNGSTLSAGGDPMKPEVLAERPALARLLRQVAFVNADR